MLYSIHLHCVWFKDHNCHCPPAPTPPTSVSVLWCPSSEQWCIPISRCLGLQTLSRYNQLKIRIFASKSDPKWLHTYYQAHVIKNEHCTHKPSSWCRKIWDENPRISCKQAHMAPGLNTCLKGEGTPNLTWNLICLGYSKLEMSPWPVFGPHPPRC